MLSAPLENLGVVYAAQEKFAFAEPLYRRARALRERAAVEGMNNHAQALEGKGDLAAAERLCRSAVESAGRIPKLEGPANVGEADLLAGTLQIHAMLLRKLKRDSEAAKVEARLRSMLTPQP